MDHNGPETFALTPEADRAAPVSRRLELAGRTFGRWTVLRVAEGSGEKLKWRCRCACGTERDVRAGHLVAGRTRSCGCLGDGQDPQRIADALTVPLDTVDQRALQRVDDPDEFDDRDVGVARGTFDLADRGPGPEVAHIGDAWGDAGNLSRVPRGTSAAPTGDANVLGSDESAASRQDAASVDARAYSTDECERLHRRGFHWSANLGGWVRPMCEPVDDGADADEDADPWRWTK